MEIAITKEEQEIFDMILSCRPSKVIPRVAGGWVRDKLMGVSSYDMDIALENLSGYDFAILLENAYKNSVSSVSLIQSNPNKSKHLETAVCKINGLMIDFVNLRCEKYTDTRIPTITIGTAEEDSFRRDLTINSLFYNLVTRNIEDHTGLGIKDIKNKILRTPLDPLTTFSDDPLRILRIFRFRSKLNFKIQDDVYAALKNKSLKMHLKNKVSKERIHIEIFKMIDSDFGHEGIYEIINNNYTEAVFGLENNIQEMKKFYREISSKSVEAGLDRRWIYNLYIILLSSSAYLVEDEKTPVFLNVKICRDELCSSSKICTTIRCIEEGIFRCGMIDFTDLSFYNIYFVLNILGTYWHEILFFDYIKNRNENVKNFVDFIQQNNIKYIENDKPSIDIKNIDKRLFIDKKYISYFVKECLIFQQSNNTGDLFDHLLNKKAEIIEKFRKLEIIGKFRNK
ncbi:hypothetical protein P3W45_000010 [Vairimorpha bombi]|jgi:tRNA nucleotidyltransferase (CCA-adding enzyme)